MIVNTSSMVACYACWPATQGGSHQHINPVPVKHHTVDDSRCGGPRLTDCKGHSWGVKCSNWQAETSCFCDGSRALRR